MQEEALKTERHNDEWFTGTKLRSRQVPFVSAGSLTSPELSFVQPNKPQFQDEEELVPVSKSLAELEISHVQLSSVVEERAPSPTLSNASSDEVVFIGKDPEARKGVTKHDAALGWGTSSTAKHTKQPVKPSPNVKHDSVSLGCSSGDDIDEEILRDYIENAGGLDSLSELAGLQFVGRPLALGEDFGNLSDDEVGTGTDTNAAASFSTFPTHQTLDGPSNRQVIIDQIEGDVVIAQRLAAEDDSDLDDDSDSEDDDLFIMQETSRIRATADAFASATLMADMLEAGLDDEFDITDPNRPSLQRRKKKGAHALPPVLSDVDLMDALEQSPKEKGQERRTRRVTEARSACKSWEETRPQREIQRRHDIGRH
jgi:hypothetical protein